MPEENSLVKNILLEHEFLRGQNANYRSYCQDIADYFLPRKGWITSIRTKGERTKFNFLYDSTGVQAVRATSAGFHSHLTNPTSRWFMLEPQDKRFMRRYEVRSWFKEVDDKIFAALEGSNFYNVIQEFYTDFVAFGTGTYSQLDDARDIVRFNEIPVDQVSRVTDGQDRLSAVYREFRLTARQALAMWGEDAGKSVIESARDNKPFAEFEFIHFVGERNNRQDGKKDQLNMPIQSVWIAKKDKHLIAERGFLEMPYISEVFYRDANDPNGFSPAMDVLPDVKLLNAMKRTVIRAAMKAADPPMIMPSEGFILPLNFNPGAMNFRDDKTTKDDLQPLMVNKGRMDISVEMLGIVKEDINTGMFVKLFQTLEAITKQMTIPEVAMRKAEGMSLLGPVVGRANKGVLSPTIIRLYNQLRREDMLPPPPEVLLGSAFVPVYLSPLAKAQRQSEVTEIQAFLGEVQAIGTILPNALDKINEDKAIDVLARMRGITPEILRDDRDVEKRRQHRAEQEQMMTAMQMAGGAAQVAKTGAEAARSSAEAQAAGSRK